MADAVQVRKATHPGTEQGAVPQDWWGVLIQARENWGIHSDPPLGWVPCPLCTRAVNNSFSSESIRTCKMQLQKKHGPLIIFIFEHYFREITHMSKSGTYLIRLRSSASANQCFAIKVNGALLITWSRDHYVQFTGSSALIILCNGKSFASPAFVRHEGPIQFQITVFCFSPTFSKKNSFCCSSLEGVAMTKWLNKTVRFTRAALQLICHHLRLCYSWNSHFEISPPRESVL